jgi:hypothetical protein
MKISIVPIVMAALLALGASLLPLAGAAQTTAPDVTASAVPGATAPGGAMATATPLNAMEPGATAAPGTTMAPSDAMATTTRSSSFGGGAWGWLGLLGLLGLIGLRGGSRSTTIT